MGAWSGPPPLENAVKITGRVKLFHFRRGSMVGYQSGRNLVVDSGRNLITDIIRTNNGSYPIPKYFAFGSGGGIIDASGLDLISELLNIPSGANRTTGTISLLVLYELAFWANVAKNAGAADTVREIGIFNAAPHGPDSGTMLCRFLPQPFVMENGDNVLTYWALTFGD